MIFCYRIYSKYAWVVLLKYKKEITATLDFQEILDEFGRKPNKLWVDKGSKFYNRPMKLWLQDSDMEMYSAHNRVKSVVDERFIRTLKNKIYKYMICKILNDLDDRVNEYHNKYHTTIKMNPVNAKSSTYINFNKENNKEDPKFNFVDHV